MVKWQRSVTLQGSTRMYIYVCVSAAGDNFGLPRLITPELVYVVESLTTKALAHLECVLGDGIACFLGTALFRDT